MLKYNAGTGSLEFELAIYQQKRIMYIGFFLTEQEAFERSANFLGSLIAFADYVLSHYQQKYQNMPEGVESRSWESFLTDLMQDRDKLCTLKIEVLKHVPNLDLYTPKGMSIQEMRKMGHYLPSQFVFAMMKS